MKHLRMIKEDICISGPVFAVLMTALVLTGGFSEFFSCVIAVAASAVLIVCAVRNKKLMLRFDLRFCAVAAVAAFYLLTSFYGVDGGESLIGFVKFLPVVVFAVLLAQDDRCAASLRRLLPYIALVMGALSLPLCLIPSLGFSVDGRLGGFFQYPNTFAMLLLIGELLLLSEKEKSAFDVICAVLLFVLILLTGSRSVFVLTVVFSFVMLVINAKKRGRIILLSAAILLIAAGVLLYPVWKNIGFISRLLSISVFESTFAGRLLYWYDALPLILKHPFGMGYLGYYFTEQSVQTGVYAVRYLHNDLLQLMLDVGWAPALAVVCAVGKSVFSKKTEPGRKLILIAFFAHICFDFDLQFTAMWFVLLILTDDASGRLMKVKKASAAIWGCLAALLSCYFAAALGFAYFGAYETAASLYPPNTEARIQLLTQTDDELLMNAEADKILRQNEYVQIAYDAKARYALSEGDVKKLMTYKHKVFEVAPFDYDEYEEYASILIYCIDLYRQEGDTVSAEECQKELVDTRKMLNGLEDRLSYFGRIIADQPQTSFPDDVNEYIDEIENLSVYGS